MSFPCRYFAKNYASFTWTFFLRNLLIHINNPNTDQLHAENILTSNPNTKTAWVSNELNCCQPKHPFHSINLQFPFFSVVEMFSQTTSILMSYEKSWKNGRKQRFLRFFTPFLTSILPSQRGLSAWEWCHLHLRSREHIHSADICTCRSWEHIEMWCFPYYRNSWEVPLSQHWFLRHFCCLDIVEKIAGKL